MRKVTCLPEHNMLACTTSRAPEVTLLRLTDLGHLAVLQPPTAGAASRFESNEDAMQRGIGGRFGAPPPHVPKHREKMTGACVEAVTSFSGCAADGTIDNTHVYVVTANLDATMVSVEWII